MLGSGADGGAVEEAVVGIPLVLLAHHGDLPVGWMHTEVLDLSHPRILK